MSDVRKIAILGIGGNSIDILDTIHEINLRLPTPAYECIGFLDDSEANWGREIQGLKVVGSLASAAGLPDVWLVNGIGSPTSFRQKEAIIARTGCSPDRFATLVHPTASVSRLATLGAGTVVFQNATITSNVSIGNHVVVLPNSIVSHDCVVGDYTCIAGGVCISGGVRIGRSCYLGTNSTFKNGVVIGAEVMIGMGSNVLADVAPGAVVVGNPAKPLR